MNATRAANAFDAAAPSATYAPHAQAAQHAPPAPPWWHFRIVWFAMGLPALVAVASLFTAGLAWHSADVPLTGPRSAQAQAAEDAAEHGARAIALEPAERARNHAATPVR